jgi:hypothetical protein
MKSKKVLSYTYTNMKQNGGKLGKFTFLIKKEIKEILTFFRFGIVM